jgi:hypothetical protein
MRADIEMQADLRSWTAMGRLWGYKFVGPPSSGSVRASARDCLAIEASIKLVGARAVSASGHEAVPLRAAGTLS